MLIPAIFYTSHNPGQSRTFWSVMELCLLTPLKISYEAAKKRAEPYNKIVGELPEMRRDTVNLVRQAVADNRRTYVLVNNHAEGNAPLTVEALVDQLRA